MRRERDIDRRAIYERANVQYFLKLFNRLFFIFIFIFYFYLKLYIEMFTSVLALQQKVVSETVAFTLNNIYKSNHND